MFIGDTLTDNVRDPDHYRFHDVFHLAYAAILHWSPVVRALIKQKRKSVQYIDENEDGAGPLLSKRASLRGYSPKRSRWHTLTVVSACLSDC